MPLQSEVAVDEYLQELVPGFVESRRKDIAQLSSLLEAGDFVAIAKICHTIKGVARPYGFPSLETLARSLETAARAQDLVACGQVLAEMKTYLAKY
jgi:HPt (histidine-containing phosphotransfer) domain-containing protein